MVIKIAVVEDDDSSAEMFIDYIKRFGLKSGDTFSVDKFSDGDEIIGDYKAHYDVIFLDIQMKRHDGMTTAKEIRAMDKDVILIFITNLAQYAIEGYSVNALDFLLKPVSYQIFEELLKRLTVKIKEAKKKSYIMLPSKNGVTKLDVNEIYYMECFSHNIVIYTKNESFSVTGTLSRFEEELAADHFFRCGRSHILNLAYVVSLTGREVTVGHYNIFISKPRRKEILEAIMSYHAKNMYDSGI